MAFFFYLVLFVISMVLNGWVFQIFWEWFIVPIFDFQLLSVPQAIGLSLFLSFGVVGARGWDTVKDTYDSSMEKYFIHLFVCFFYPLFALSIGWIIHGFI